MSESSRESPVLVFSQRPKSVPSDLRISWRHSLTLLMLHYCRQNRASFAKLHLLNSALCNSDNRERVLEILNKGDSPKLFTIRIEPAFSRNLDLLIAKGLAEWLIASTRIRVQLTSIGVDAALAINEEDHLFVVEREFLTQTSRLITEAFVQSVVKFDR